jgi:hypothetical protein
MRLVCLFWPAPAPYPSYHWLIGASIRESSPDLGSRRSGHDGFLRSRFHILHSCAEIKQVDDFSYGTGWGVIVMLDELDAALRLISHGPHRWTASWEQVCLHPSLAIPVVEGLYFEQCLLKRDLSEDWQRFWPPLRQALSADSCSVTQVQFWDF